MWLLKFGFGEKIGLKKLKNLQTEKLKLCLITKPKLTLYHILLQIKLWKKEHKKTILKY